MSKILVQYPEKNFSSRDIAELSGGGLLVRNIWTSIQGEGPYAGYSATFVRLAGCNRGAKIDCDFCDTDFLVERSRIMDIDEIVSIVKRVPTPLIVLTGGEPLMHPRVEELIAALSKITIVQIETNGDYVRENTAPEAVIVASPKLMGRTGKYSRPKMEMLKRADYLKFVVSGDPENPYHYLPDYVHEFAQAKGTTAVYISPMNEYRRAVSDGEIASMWGDMYDPTSCAINYRYAAELVQKYHFCLSLQQHVFVAVP